MNPGGRVVAEANYPQWRALIFPFADRPDIGVDGVFTAVPDDRPWLGVPTVFTDRWYDDGDGWYRRGPGADQGFNWRVLPRPKFDVPLTAVSGTPEQWRSGCSYEDYLAGEHGPPGCCELRQYAEGGWTLTGTGYRWCSLGEWRWPRRYDLTCLRVAGSFELHNRTGILDQTTFPYTWSGTVTGTTGIVYLVDLACGGPTATLTRLTPPQQAFPAGAVTFGVGSQAGWQATVLCVLSGVPSIYILRGAERPD